MTAPAIQLVNPPTRPTSFSWITAQLALAMAEVGARVSIAWGPARRFRQALADELSGEQLHGILRMRTIRRARSNTLGWLHPWYPYRRRPTHAFVALNSEPEAHLGGRSWLASMPGTQLFAVSSFVKAALIRGGMAAELVDVVPLGRSFPIQEVRSDWEGRVLAFATDESIMRLGTDIVIQAYARALARGFHGGLTIRVYAGDGSEVAKMADEAGIGTRVRLLTSRLSKEALAGVYAEHDVLLAPFRGEGFGIKVLDAMACGLPVIMPAFGGPMDYAVPGSFMQIDATRSREPVGADLAADEPPQLWAEPDVESAVLALLKMADDAQAREHMAEAARKAALPFTWRNAAERLIANLDLGA